MEKSRRDFNKDIEIDPDNLEDENLTHPSKCMYYGELLADAMYNRDLAKAKLKLTESELNDELQRTWEQYYEKFPTESIRDGWVIRQKRYKIDLDILLKKEHDVNLLKSVKDSFDARGYSLGGHISIMLSGLNSSPKLKRTEDKKEQIKRAKLSKNPLRRLTKNRE